jgi:hypothetical protein
MLSYPITVLGGQPNGQYSGANSSSIWKQFSVTQAQLPTGIDDLRLLPGGEVKYTIAEETLTARQQLSTLAFVDDEFAEEAGFLIHDDLSV